MKKVIALMILFPSLSQAVELGYTVTQLRERTDVAQSARGVAGRINFGGGHEGRYSGDRWSLAVGYINPRLPDKDWWIRSPEREEVHVDGYDGFFYGSFVHRWYAPTLNLAPRLRFYVGTGISYRDAVTCPTVKPCWDGTPSVSSKWAFHQSFGLKWRERLEISWEHDSTARFSMINLGDDYLRFSLFFVVK